LLFYGCEKVIDVDLNQADPQIVIEGNVSNGLGFAEVKISKTSSYFDTLQQEKISGANILLTTDFGDSYTFNEVEKGVYKSNENWFREESEYSLEVDVEGVLYESSALLNPPVSIDSVKFYYENSPFFDPGYYVNVYLLDPPGIENFYRMKYSKNGELQNSIDDLILFDDRFVDGNIIEVTLFNQPFEENDTVTIQLISLDKGAYDYLRTFRDLVNSNPGSAAPANPISNISNGSLGYFSPWSSNTRSAIIKFE
jgi:hypothetical protein